MAAKTRTADKPKSQIDQLRDDLLLTTRELSGAYEELSIFHRLSQTLAGLTLEQIYDKLLDEIQAMLDVKTAAIMLINEEGNELYTVFFRGKWPGEKVFKKGNNVFWTTIEQRSPKVVGDIIGLSARIKISPVLICPVIGKKKALGAIIIGERASGKEFYSADIKFLIAIASQAALAIENASLYQELENLLLSTVVAFGKAIDSRSHWTYGHSDRVTKYAVDIAREMEMDEGFIEKLKICSLLHDIGKITIPIDILDKPSGLTELEMNQMNRHPFIGARIFEDFKPFKDIVEGIKHHHERWDGNGFYGELKGDKIPLMARIIAVADAYDALTSDRPYRKKKNREEVITEIADKAGKQFDPKLVQIFFKVMDTYGQKEQND